MALNYPYSSNGNLNFPTQQFFPQPQGNVYLINNFNEVATIPVGSGVSIALCLKEGIMYIKTMQNGSPMMVGYRLNSLDGINTNVNVNEKIVTAAPTANNNEETLKEYDFRLKKIEEFLFKDKEKGTSKQGGKLEWEV